MVGNLRKRAQLLGIEDLNWYLDAYMRAATRLNTEERKPTGLNVEKLQRRLQALFDKIEASLEDEKTKTNQKRATQIAINHSISDHHLPRELLQPYGLDDDRDSA
jgi:hypothetical protein